MLRKIRAQMKAKSPAELPFPKGEKRPAEIMIEELKKLAEHFGIDPSKTPLDIIQSVNAKLESVPYVPYPVSFSTVDMIPVHWDPEGVAHLLMGRKYNQELFQLCGGFRDPMESNEVAAARELHEEATVLLDPERMEYLGSLFIDDNRYKNSPHKVTTSVFSMLLNKAEADSVKGGDDIEEVRWYSVEELKDSWDTIVRPVHHNLFKYFMGKNFPQIQLKEITIKDEPTSDQAPDVLPGDVQHK